MTRRSKEQWRELIADQQSSGLSAAAYCRQYDINPKYFSTRKTQLQGGKDKFVRVSPKPSYAPHGGVQFSKAMTKQPRIRVIDIEFPRRQGSCTHFNSQGAAEKYSCRNIA